jgi:hypothetical protein
MMVGRIPINQMSLWTEDAHTVIGYRVLWAVVGQETTGYKLLLG